MKKIQLPNGLFSLVDDDDYEKLNQYKWRLGRRSVVRHQVKEEYKSKKRKTILMHRMIMNPEEGYVVDHINHNIFDNRKENLRICTQQQNSFNRKKQKSAFHSKYKGVSFYKKTKKWMASIKLNNKNIYLGIYDEEENAAKAYKVAAKKYHGEYAYA